MSSLDELLNLSLEDKRGIIAEYIWCGVFLSPGLFVCLFVFVSLICLIHRLLRRCCNSLNFSG
jgi:hypothetical protein